MSKRVLRVPAADQTLRILLLLAGSRGPLPASMIASRLNIPRSSVYQLLAALEEHAFVIHLSDEKRYGLGPSAVELSSGYSRQQPLTRLGIPLMQQLTDQLGLGTHLAVLTGTDVLYIIEQRAPHAPSLVTDVDVRLPAALTATGRAILASMPKAHVRALFPNQSAFAPRAGMPVSVDKYSKLRRILDGTTERGYSLEEEEITPGFSSVGSPVLDHLGWPVAGIAATFRVGALSQRELQDVASSVRQTSDALSSRLYGRKR